ncbi:MAG: CDP-alcohol phosphatidyltransferase family protein [Promethearchaeota archaeon]
MPSKFRVRKIFRPVVISIAKLFCKLNIKPNHASFMMLFCSVISFTALVWWNNLILFGIFIFITGIMDGVDGAIARLSDQSTKFGAFLDSTLDRISEMIIYAALFIRGQNFFILFNSTVFKIFVIITILGSLLISYQRSRASNEIMADFDVGLFARSERLFTLFIISIIPFMAFFSVGFIILSIGITATALFRFFKYRIYFLADDLKSVA